MIVINLFGSPGTGKSTTAYGLSKILKSKGYECEMVKEYAKELVWAKRFKELENQSFVTAEQHRRQYMHREGVDILVTDSPLLLGSIYAPKHYTHSFHDHVEFLFNQYNNVNIFLKRTKEYNPAGREQTEEESNAIAFKIREMLAQKNIPTKYFEDLDIEEADQVVYEFIKPMVEKFKHNR